MYAIAKRILFVTFCLVVVASATAQTDTRPEREIGTILGDLKSRSNGGYGAFTAMASRFGSIDGWINGGSGAWIFSSNFVLGVGAYAFESSEIYDNYLENNCRLNGGYGGLVAGIIAWPKAPIHVGFPLLVGGGGVAYAKNYRSLRNVQEWITEDVQAYVIVEPGIELEVNMLKFLRVSALATYRYHSPIELTYDVSQLQIEGVEGNLLSRISVGLSFKFGRF